MKRAARVVLLVACMPGLNGCGIFQGRAESVKEVHYTWAKMGTPARVAGTADKPQVVHVLVPDADGVMQPGRVDANGMVLIDEPTLEYYRRLDEQEQDRQRIRAEKGP